MQQTYIFTRRDGSSFQLTLDVDMRAVAKEIAWKMAARKQTKGTRLAGAIKATIKET